MWLPARPGVMACGLLDFQDAQQGHPSYDLVSLIEDARRDVSPTVHAACLAHYLDETGLDKRDFGTGFALMAAQRHARIIGLFIRLLKRDGKPDYLPHLPRVWRMFERSLQHEALAPRENRYRHDPGGRTRRAHAAAHRHHAQAAASRGWPLPARALPGSTNRPRRHEYRRERPPSRPADRRSNRGPRPHRVRGAIAGNRW